MRMPNDTRLAELVDGIDIILGGHDHHYEVKKVEKCASHACYRFSVHLHDSCSCNKLMLLISIALMTKCVAKTCHKRVS